MKKLSIGGYINAIAAVLSAVGFVLVIVSHTVSSTNALSNFSTVVLMGIVSVVAAVISLVAAPKLGNHNPGTAIGILVNIFLNVMLIGTTADQRIMMIAGLFSYNSGNTEGWSVFYVCVAAWVCLLVGALLAIVSSFLNSVKEA